MGRPTAQDAIARLMDRLDPYSGYPLNEDLADITPGGSAGAPAELLDRGQPPASKTVDARGKLPITEMRECQAASCTMNIKGNKCSLNHISVNKTGGCADYEAKAEEYDDDGDTEYTDDSDTIEGISNRMPTMADHPSSMANMKPDYQPGIGS